MGLFLDVYYQGPTAMTELVVANIGTQIPGFNQYYLQDRTRTLNANTTSLGFSIYNQRGEAGDSRGVARLYCKDTADRRCGDLELTLPSGGWHWSGRLMIVFVY